MISAVSETFSMFADFTGLGYSMKFLDPLMKWSGEQFNPVILCEPLSNGQVIQRIGMISSDGSKKIQIMSNRIDVVLFATRKEGFNSSELDINADEALQIFKKIYEIFNDIIPIANRMAYISSYVYHEIEDEEKKIYRNRFLKIPEGYSEATLTDEFSARYCSREEIQIQEYMEKLNMITNIYRLDTRMLMFPIQIDGYKIDFDINTSQENKKNRFSVESFGFFLNAINDKMNLLKRGVIDDVK